MSYGKKSSKINSSSLNMKSFQRVTIPKKIIDQAHDFDKQLFQISQYSTTELKNDEEFLEKFHKNVRINSLFLENLLYRFIKKYF